MSRRKRRKAQTSPSLFPFLAVLICTMGAIIVLLVLVVKNADVQATIASEVNEQELAEQKQSWQDRLELEQSQVATLKELRPELKQRLDKEKALFGHLADHVSRLQAELKNLRQSLDALNATEKSGDEQTAKQLEQQAQQLKQQIATAKKQLESKQQDLATARPAFSIIPNSQGGNGTFRRPIFVECSSQGVTLQPYGITLGPNDFPRALGPGNPLDLALLMIRDYWNQADPNQTEGQPYPLFVVRPSGSKAFAAARKAMKSWVDEFGYELVTAEIEIEYPEPDQQFKERLVSTIEQARIEQKNRAVAISRQEALSQIRRLENQSTSSQGYRASSLGGGFVRERGSGASNPNAPRTSFLPASQSRTADSNPNSTLSKANSQFDSSQLTSEANETTKGNRNSSFVPLANESSTTDGAKKRGSVRANTADGSGGPNSSPSSANEAAVPQLPAESLARTRGADWALPSKANNAIQVRKPIKVQVNADSIQIVEIGKGIRTIPFGRTTATAMPGLIELVWKHIDAWGIAGVNSYWKPTLNLYVAPDAQSRFNDMQILLSGSGIDLRRVQP